MSGPARRDWRELASRRIAALEELTTCYRLGKRPTEKLFDELDATVQASSRMAGTIFEQQSVEHEAASWVCCSCSLQWEFSDAARPSEHGMRYCPGCGARIEEEWIWEETE